ncbi:MAG: TIR domain-containing protein [Muribaculaceae bacterium]|nr:TIR domain-containing protein [Muribaculaceae bacterium]
MSSNKSVRYKAFISYRKTCAEYAELVKTTLVEKYCFNESDIFLDKHNIGPEYFDTKLKKAVEQSSSLILIVTNDCFIPKSEGEDWYLEEIQTALVCGVTIIPVLFDEIKSLDTNAIRIELEKKFKSEEIERLIKLQSIRYDFDLSDATFNKLADFIEKADKPNTFTTLLRFIKGIVAVIAVLALAFALFVGIGFLWGNFSSGTDDKDILIENTRIDGNTAIFEFGGLEAKYDLDQDSIFIDLENFNGKIPESNIEIFTNSCSVSGATILFKRNVGYIKYFKFLKGGSKTSKFAYAGVSIAACIGSFCGFSQGSKWGRTLHQHDQAMTLYSKLRDKNEWEPVFSEDILLNIKYRKLRNKGLPLINLFGYNEEILKDISTFTWCYPDDEISVARDAGLTTSSIVCKYNNWEIGKGSAIDLNNEIERSKSISKNIIIYEVDSLHQQFKLLILPEGTVGIRFDFPKEKSDISFIVNQLNAWSLSNTDKPSY